MTNNFFKNKKKILPFFR